MELESERDKHRFPSFLLIHQLSIISWYTYSSGVSFYSLQLVTLPRYNFQARSMLGIRLRRKMHESYLRIAARVGASTLNGDLRLDLRRLELETWPRYVLLKNFRNRFQHFRSGKIDHWQIPKF